MTQLDKATLEKIVEEQQRIMDEMNNTIITQNFIIKGLREKIKGENNEND